MKKYEITKAVRIMSKADYQYRGLVVGSATFLERYFDMYIANYFCEFNKKEQQFIDLLLGNNRVSFDTKRKIFDTILKKNSPDFFQINPNFSKDMNTVMYERNCFAHCTPDTSEEAMKRCQTDFGLVKYGKNKRTDWYDSNKMDEISKCIGRCIATMGELISKEILHPPVVKK